MCTVQDSAQSLDVFVSIGAGKDLVHPASTLFLCVLERGYGSKISDHVIICPPLQGPLRV